MSTKDLFWCVGAGACGVRGGVILELTNGEKGGIYLVK